MGDTASFLDKYSPTGIVLDAVGIHEPFKRYTPLGWGKEGNVTTDFFRSLTPEFPEPPTPEAPTEVGEEGIRRGEMQRQSRRRELGALYLTRGQERSPTLGGMKQTLG